MTVINKITTYLNTQTSIVPLAIFRMAFGFLMTFSMLRFIYNGWIEAAYITPTFHFTYQYFDWVQPFSTGVMYAIVIGCAIAAFFMAIGLFYRAATVFFFLSFTYLELIEKTWYLNHYYLVSLLAFLLILVPANRKFSIDILRKPGIRRAQVSNWTIFIFKLQLSVVYFFGGVAKLSSDWLLEAQPMKIWLKAKTDLPLLGGLLDVDVMPYLFSWGGIFYDLLIPFLLWSRKSRPIAYVLVLVFHLLTHVLFNIGLFPWMMIFCSLIFITEQEWRQLFKLTRKGDTFKTSAVKKTLPNGILVMLSVFFLFQFSLPLRHFIKTDNVLWTENGFRFSWQVMVMEKTGHTIFTVKDAKNNKQWKEYPSNRLTEIQETQMSFQPDMIWQYAQHLEAIFKEKGVENPEIYVDAKVALNGRRSQLFIEPSLDLTSLDDVDAVYDYIVPLKD